MKKYADGDAVEELLNLVRLELGMRPETEFVQVTRLVTAVTPHVTTVTAGMTLGNKAHCDSHTTCYSRHDMVENIVGQWSWA